MQHGLRPASGFFLRIEQGHEVQRPSLVLLRGRTVDGAPEVSVGGSVIPIVRGELY
jgi:trans-2,3-dihydro-3-hydroxyanthranilate isomerase